jgi:hypothetical protein
MVCAIERSGIIFNLLKKHINVKDFKQDLLRDDFSLAYLPDGLQKEMSVVQ